MLAMESSQTKKTRIIWTKIDKKMQAREPF